MDKNFFEKAHASVTKELREFTELEVFAKAQPLQCNLLDHQNKIVTKT